MIAMMDATCPRCKKKFGWRGTFLTRPPCPRCGHDIPQAQKQADHETMQEWHREMFPEEYKGGEDSDRSVS